MKEISLYYWKGARNFGDLLSPMIVEFMAGRPVRHTSNPYDADLIALGSHLQHINNPQSMRGRIWGTGQMWGKLPGQFDTRGMTDAIVDCIRGRYSRSFWHLPDSVPIGDPGLLTPFLYRQPEPSRERLFTFIPHFQHERYFLNTFPIDGFHPRVCKYVSPQNDVDIVVEEIQRGEVVISSSLHGLIVAESFGIPTVWIMPDPLEKSADRFNIIMKYGDYYSAFPSGVKRIPVFPRPGWRQKDFENLAREAKYVSSFDIYEVRKGLIESFPYELWKA